MSCSCDFDLVKVLIACFLSAIATAAIGGLYYKFMLWKWSREE
jgi:hypothetical protein